MIIKNYSKKNITKKFKKNRKNNRISNNKNKRVKNNNTKKNKRRKNGGSAKRQRDEDVILQSNKRQEIDNALMDINDIPQQNQQQNSLYSLGFNEDSLEMYFEDQPDVTPEELIERFKVKLQEHNIDVSLDEIRRMGQEDEIGNSGLSKYEIANEVLYE
jgi:hypothetical protein